MTHLVPLREIPSSVRYGKNDVLVIFGEVFNRGYVNGIIQEALRHQMKVIYSTVGRRENGKLRALNESELAQMPKPLINVPLEAGFDLEPSEDGTSPVDQLKGVKMDEWDKVRLDWNQIEQSQAAGEDRFKQNVQKYLRELAPMITKGSHVIFVHTMAGGIPRAKIYMPTLNRICKGIGDRFTSSADFQSSDMGRLAEESFNSVTADTFKTLVELSSELREKQIQSGGSVRYLAYGYHGTEVMIHRNYQWQTYTPYFQGWAKMRLENYAYEFYERGVDCCVFNCPEILTNSSGVFQGVELSLYPLMGALRKETPESTEAKRILKECESLLKPEHTIDHILAFTNNYLTHPIILDHCVYPEWPQHNSREQMELMLASSDELVGMHKNPKELITASLSEEVFKACGISMLNESFHPRSSVLWIGHDLVARVLGQIKG